MQDYIILVSFLLLSVFKHTVKVPSAWLRTERRFLYGKAPGLSPGTSAGIGPSTHRSSLHGYQTAKTGATVRQNPSFRLHCSSWFNDGGVFTSVNLGVLGNLYGVVGRKDPTGAGAHVVALVPVILRLDLHQQRIVHLQLQLIIVSRDKPVDKEVASSGLLWELQMTMTTVCRSSSPVNGPVALILLLSVYDTREQTEGLCAWKGRATLTAVVFLTSIRPPGL